MTVIPVRELGLVDGPRSTELRQGATVGRLVFTQQASPALDVAEFHWWRGDLVIRIDDTSALALQSGDPGVVFEAGQPDGDGGRVEKVVAIGRASVVTEVADLIELLGLFSRPLVGGRCDYFVRIRADMAQPLPSSATIRSTSCAAPDSTSQDRPVP